MNPVNNNVGAVDIIAMNPNVVIDHMYSYTGPFRDGTALIPHPVERIEKYAERRQFSCMTNTFATIVDATWKPVFDNPVVRETESDSFRQFLGNVDNRGTPIGLFMRHVARETKKHSTLFIVMDNFTEADMPETEYEARNARALPYVYTKKPQDVKEYTLDRFGNVVSITFANGVFVDTDGKKYQQYLDITGEAFTSYYVKQSDKGEIKTIIDQSQNPIGFVPVIISRDEQPEVGVLCPEPRMYSVMRVCFVIYNKDTEMREIDRRQSFSTAYFFGTDAPSPGTGNALLLPVDSKPPGFLEPNPGIQGTNIEGAKYYQDNLYRMCEQTGVIGVKSASSGVALAFEFMARDSVLAETASICEAVEYQMAMLFSKWTNTEVKYVCKYDRSYTPSDDAMQIKVIDEVLINADRVPSRILKDAYRWLARRVNPAISDEELDVMEEEIEIRKQDDMQSGGTDAEDDDQNDDTTA
jgi:hypothetical protein